MSRGTQFSLATILFASICACGSASRLGRVAKQIERCVTGDRMAPACSHARTATACWAALLTAEADPLGECAAELCPETVTSARRPEACNYLSESTVMPTEVAVDFALRAIEAEAGFEVPWWLWLRTQALAYGYSPPVDDQFVVETDAFAALLADPQRQVPDGPRTATIVRGVARAALRLQASLGDRSGQVLAAQPTTAPSNQRIIDEPMRRRLSDCASAARGALFLDPGAYREPCSHLVSDADCAAALVSGQDVLAECVWDYCDRPQHLWPEACGNLEYLASRVGEFHVAHVELAYLILEREESGLFPPRWAWQPLWSVSRAVGSGLPEERQVQIAELAATLRTELGGEVDGGDEVLVSAFALADLLSQ